MSTDMAATSMVASGRAAYIAKRSADYGVKAEVEPIIDMVKSGSAKEISSVVFEAEARTD